MPTNTSKHALGNSKYALAFMTYVVQNNSIPCHVYVVFNMFQLYVFNNFNNKIRIIYDY
jgi:hypothetical protein